MVNLVSKNTTEPLLSTCENSSSTGRRGQNRREHHPAIRNAEVFQDYEAGIKQGIIAAKYKINKSFVSKW